MIINGQHKPRLRIQRTDCACGGHWAWMRELPSGMWQMLGCVCHHWWTLAVRWR